jgi:hypothetical protein
VALGAAICVIGCGGGDEGTKSEPAPRAEAVTRADAAELAECLTGAGFEARRDNAGNPHKRESTAVEAMPLDDPDTRVTLLVFATPEDLARRSDELDRRYAVFSSARNVGVGTTAGAAARRAKKEIEGSGCLPS